MTAMKSGLSLSHWVWLIKLNNMGIITMEEITRKWPIKNTKWRLLRFGGKVIGVDKDEKNYNGWQRSENSGLMMSKFRGMGVVSGYLWSINSTLDPWWRAFPIDSLIMYSSNGPSTILYTTVEGSVIFCCEGFYIKSILETLESGH